MKINKDSLQARINNLSKQKKVPSNAILQYYFFDSFLRRLSKSNYVNNFVLKGGFLLSSSLGIDFRSTMDIDFLLKNKSIERANIESIIKEIISIDVDDGINFHLQKIGNIRLEDSYGGYNFTLLGKLENIKVNVNIDVATGDPITPHAINYKYKCLFDNNVLLFASYNYETMIAEKLETILRRGLTNSRCKDFYDLFIIYKMKQEVIDNKVLKGAYIKTSTYRNFLVSYDNAIEIINNIAESKAMAARWDLYCKKSYFANGILFIDVIDNIKSILNIVHNH